MKLYIGNATQQVHEFIYWLPEVSGFKMEVIPIGGQRQIAGDDWNPASLESVIAHHRRYGMVRDDEKPPSHVVGLVYAIDRPVKLDRLNGFITHNFDVLVRRGRATRQDAAIQVSEQIEQMMFERQLPDRLKRLEMSVQEDSQSPEFSQGVAVSREVPVGEQPPRRRVPRRAA